MRATLMGVLAAMAGTPLHAAEVVVRNDSLDDFGTAVIVWGFVAGEKAASWLTSPCNGNIRAVQIFWRSPTGTTGQTIHRTIEIFRSGTFPNPGSLAEVIGGPVLTDGVINEWRFLDDQQAIPLIVPVTANETFVVAFTFDFQPTPNSDPSVVRDTDGIQPGRNAIYATIGGPFFWFDAAALGVTGDWVIRAVVDCEAGAFEADVGVGLSATPPTYTAGAALTYTLVIDNAGPSASPSTTVVDIFPAAYTGVSWTCSGSGGATCAAAGNGNITENVSLPAGGEVVFDISGTVAPGTTGTLSNTATAVVGGGVTDPFPGNNTVTLNIVEATVDDDIFADGFEG
ncbi:MAG TPA: DUF11 domain-containing protein [Xanthomonadaceae bacterium]|nr:DUF11 domain-containing protein [Xanthomonadaceae bacterium]